MFQKVWREQLSSQLVESRRDLMRRAPAYIRALIHKQRSEFIDARDKEIKKNIERSPSERRKMKHPCL